MGARVGVVGCVVEGHRVGGVGSRVGVATATTSSFITTHRPKVEIEHSRGATLRLRAFPYTCMA